MARRRERTQEAGQGGRRQERPADNDRREGRTPRLRIATDADITVLMWNKHTVKVNHGFKGELTDKDIETIVSDIPKVLSK